jgi:hypothetical protein
MSTDRQNEVEYLGSEKMKGLSFSEALRVDNILYLSPGQPSKSARIHPKAQGSPI